MRPPLHNWTRAEAEAMHRDYLAGGNVCDVAAAHGTSVGVMYRAFDKFALPIRHASAKTANAALTGAQLRRLHAEYMRAERGVAEIAAECGVSVYKLKQRWRQLGLRIDARPGVTPTALSEAQTRAAHAEYAHGDDTVPELAARYNVSVHMLKKQFRTLGLPVDMRRTLPELRSLVARKRRAAHAPGPRTRTISLAEAQELLTIYKRPGETLATVARRAYVATPTLLRTFAAYGLDYQPYRAKRGRRREV